MGKDICIYGGTFDPVHIGHLIVARAAAEELGIERVTLIPAMSPPHKESVVASIEHRLAMLRLAVEDQPLFEVSDIEASRSGPSYTFDTVSLLKSMYGDDVRVRVLIGMDMLSDLPNWYRVGDLIQQAGFVVVARSPDQYPIDQIQSKLSRSFGLAKAEQLLGGMVESPIIDITSTDIRKRIKEGKSIQYFTPDSVIKYIYKNKLYV